MIGIALTPEEFTTLLKAAAIANIVANGRQRGRRYEKEFVSLEHTLFEKASALGIADVSEQHKDAHGAHWHPSKAFLLDEDFNRVLDEYDDAIFWDELADRLAERDLERLYGRTALESIEDEEYERLHDALAEKYDVEFLLRGVDRLRIRPEEARV